MNVKRSMTDREAAIEAKDIKLHLNDFSNAEMATATGKKEDKKCL